MLPSHFPAKSSAKPLLTTFFFAILSIYITRTQSQQTAIMSNSFTSFSPYQTPPDESRSKVPSSDAKSKAKSKSKPTTSTSKPNPFSFSSYQSGTSSAESSSRYPASASAGG